jgi:hypothetical protein
MAHIGFAGKTAVTDAGQKAFAVVVFPARVTHFLYKLREAAWYGS